MAIRVKIGKAEDEGTTASQLAKTPDVKVRLDIRKTLDGNLIISDHPDITIVIIPTKRKILSLAKQLNSGVVYGAQNRLFDFLIDKGVVSPTSVEGGSIYASMEATIPEAPNIPAVKVAIINVARWLESEKPSIDEVLLTPIPPPIPDGEDRYVVLQETNGKKIKQKEKTLIKNKLYIMFFTNNIFTK